MGRHVLVAEGSEYLRSTHAATLSAAGYLVSTAADGFEVLSFIAHVKPDLILLDLSLPGVSGWEILSSIQTVTDWCDTDVITITAGNRPSEVAASWRHGCCWSMTQQVGLEDLLLVVGCLLGSRRMRHSRRKALPVQNSSSIPLERPLAFASAS